MQIQHSRLLQKQKGLVTKTLWLLLPLVLIFSLFFASPALAVPTMPCQLYGLATVDGKVSAGVTVTASIKGVQYASTVTDAASKYGYGPAFFRIPADDPGTPAVEGGVDGDTIQLSVAGISARTVVFASGSAINMDLDAASGQTSSQTTTTTPSSPAPTAAQNPVIPQSTPVTQAQNPAPAPVIDEQSPDSIPATTESVIVTQTPDPVTTNTPLVTSKVISSLSQRPPAGKSASDSDGLTLSYPIIGGIAGLVLILVISLSYSIGRMSKR
jgi:hypothetical protein